MRVNSSSTLTIRSPKSFQNAEIAVNNGIDQGVGQIIGTHATNLPLAAPDPLADGVEDISLDPLLKGEQIIGAQNEAELFRAERALVGRAQHPQHDEEVVAIILDLGALYGVDDIFQDQRMKGVSLPEMRG